MPTLGNLVVSIAADVAKLQSDMDRASSIVESGARRIQATASLANKALAGLGAGLSVAGAAAYLKNAIDTTDQIGKLAQKAGIAVEPFSRLNYAMKLGDLSSESLAKGLRQLNNDLAKAAAGNDAIAAKFTGLGFSLEQVKKGAVSQEQVILRLAALFEKLPDGPQKSAIAMAFFGQKVGSDFVPALNDGAEAIAKNIQQAERFGVVVTDTAAKAADEFNDNMTRLQAASQGAGIALANAVLPQLTQISGAMAEAAASGGLLQAALVGFGGALVGIFTDDLLTPLQKARKELSGLLQDRDKLRDPGLSSYFRLGNSSEKLDTVDRQIAAKRAEIATLETKQKTQADQAAADARAASEKAQREVKANLDKLLGDQDQANRAKEAERARERLLEQQKEAIAQLEKEKAGQLELGEVEKTRIEIESGRFAKFDDPTKARLMQLADEVDLLNQSADVHKVLIDLERQRAELEDKAQQKRTEDARQVFEQTRTPQEALQLEIERLKQLPLDTDTYARAVRKAVDESIKLQEKANALKGTWKDLGLTFQSAFEDAIAMSKDLSDVLSGVRQDLLRLATRDFLSQPLLDAVHAALKDTSGSGVLGGALSWLSGIFDGARAGGGPVSVGKAYLVGERGPELFAPGVNGSILSAASGSGVVVNVINSAGDQITTRDRGMAGGNRQIDVVVESSLTRIRSSGRGSSFGFAPQLAGR